MGFLGVYKALYDYAPQAEGELQIAEGDLLYLLEKGDDDWWKAKKKASADDDEEPTGLIPSNYVEEAQPVSHARALYEYTRQTDEELSFPEEATLAVYDTSDPDWILVGHNGDYGFVPANYIEMGDAAQHGAPEPEPEPAAPSLPSRPAAPAFEDVPSPALPPRSAPSEPSSPAAPNPAAALANVMAGRSAGSVPSPVSIPPRPHYTSDQSEEEDNRSPPLPTRPRNSTIDSTLSNDRHEDLSPPARRDTYDDYDTQPSGLSPGGFHLYNINEMVSVMGKRKKMPTTLGINLKTGMILIAPERAADGPSLEWTGDKMTHYSREGKHVFMELVKPSKSVDFHAGAKDTAEEIVNALGELAGAVRAEGLREVIMAGTGKNHKKGQMLYDFMAQGDDEVTVAVGDEVIILDDSKSEEWWQVRRLKNGKEGVVPSSYVEITGTVPATSSSSGINAGRSTIEQNRLEEERLTKEAVKAARRDDERRASERKHENGRAESSSQSRSGHRSKPDPSKVRTWTDRSKSFSVEAQFLGLKDGKINLHKMNGVKIAVPISKMSIEDLEYVERATGISLDEDKPLSEVKKARAARDNGGSSSGAKVGATIEQPKKPEYDWFQFFLSCDVSVGLCERYAQAFARDSMDESVLPDVDASILRTLGLREGDIIKVMRFLDNKYGRTRKKGGEEDGEASGGLFSGPGGTLRNNTRRGRPEPARQTSDVVDAKALQSKDGNATSATSSPAVLTPATTTTSVSTGKPSGFDDDAWDVKPAKAQTPPPAPRPAETPAAPIPAAAPAAAEPPRPAVPALTPGMQELSLLTQPLEPAKTAAPNPPPQPVLTIAQPPPAPPQAPQPTGATPGFFSALGPQQTGLPNGQIPMATGLAQPQSFARQRPLPPQATAGQPGLMPPPPPSRPFSAPQSAQPSAFAPPPLQPQMTGQVAPPGQSLNEINQARLQQQYAQQMQQMQQAAPMGVFPQPTGMYPMQAGMQTLPPQPTGFVPNQFVQPMMNGPQQMQGQFSPVQAQPTGFPGQFNPTGQQFGGVAPQPGGVNSYLPPALEPQRTAMPPPMQPQPTGMNFTQGFGNAGMAPQPQQQQAPPPIAPLQPQKTGPAPPVRFGVQPEANKLMPQATGRRANLAHATPDNPFGF
ncbi:Actin cytoskeleton-regulatory complex protein sla1 [Pleurostoma richardsiae]|uniref:Actin cytoskeleton-regulatory complex protein SLA1 n=1 Tax=Pleurostoma richardsiae TaxID=41990 RepID=A0AA38S7I7_9PEZI|nr:Actin cytoskeleton-regulatory complex protein sla1 [Pleurostoma richardsiae]